MGAANKPKTIGVEGGAGAGTNAAASTATAAPLTAPSTSSSTLKMRHFPMEEAQFVDAGKPEAAEKKILEINSSLPEGEITLKMDAVEVQHFQEMVRKLCNKSPPFADFRPVERDLLWKKCGSWPEDHLFPVVDLWRLHLLRPDSCSLFKGTDRGYSYISTVLRWLRGHLSDPLGVGCARWLANTFHSFTNRASMFEKRVLVLNAIAEQCATGGMHKQVKVGLATAVMNYSTVFRAQPKEKQGKTELIQTCEALLNGPLAKGANMEDHEPVYRLLVALGNVLIDSPTDKTPTLLSCVGGVKMGGGCEDKRILESCEDLEKVLSA